MTETTYDVRIWKTEIREGKKGTGYYVRWRVAKKSFRRPFATRALATSFRAKLISAARDGIAFHISAGLPVTMLRDQEQRNWFDFACDYVDMKWPTSSPKHRKGIADSLVPITMAMLTKGPQANKQNDVRKALRESFNKNTRSQDEPSRNDSPMKWVRSNCRDVSDLNNPDTIRAVLNQLETNLDGTKAAANTVRLRRTILLNCLDFAVEKKLLSQNPARGVQTRKTKNTLGQVDRRSVPNPTQARSLLQAVSEDRPYLTAFFALMYFAALRPEEVNTVRKQDLSLPESGWGELHLEQASPEVGTAWTDSGVHGERRSLKHRADGASRTVPCPPELTEHLVHHIETYGTANDGRLFRSRRTGRGVSSSVYGRAWANARSAALPSDAATNPMLAKRPYDLRHAAVSTWLNAGVEPTRVAAWAGHSVSVLLRVYAKCLDGGEEVARRRVQQALDAHDG